MFSIFGFEELKTASEQERVKWIYPMLCSNPRNVPTSSCHENHSSLYLKEYFLGRFMQKSGFWIIDKIHGGLNMSWPAVIIFALIIISNCKKPLSLRSKQASSTDHLVHSCVHASRYAEARCCTCCSCCYGYFSFSVQSVEFQDSAFCPIVHPIQRMQR